MNQRKQDIIFLSAFSWVAKTLDDFYTMWEGNRNGEKEISDVLSIQEADFEEQVEQNSIEGEGGNIETEVAQPEPEIRQDRNAPEKY